MDDRTTEILKRFSSSWTETENRFDELINNYQGFKRLVPLRYFISSLKQKGEDKCILDLVHQCILWLFPVL